MRDLVDKLQVEFQLVNLLSTAETEALLTTLTMPSLRAGETSTRTHESGAAPVPTILAPKRLRAVRRPSC